MTAFWSRTWKPRLVEVDYIILKDFETTVWSLPPYHFHNETHDIRFPLYETIQKEEDNEPT